MNARKPGKGTESRDLWDTATDSDAYSSRLAKDFDIDDVDDGCARVFALGQDIVRDQIRDDLRSLSTMPRGSHLGELGASWLVDSLPSRWLMRYDYEFVCRLNAKVADLRMRAKHPGFDGIPYFTRCVADDLALHLVMERGTTALAESGRINEADAEEWEYQLNGDEDAENITMLYAEDVDPDSTSQWHFDRWFDPVYYSTDSEDGADASAPDDGAPADS